MLHGIGGSAKEVIKVNCAIVHYAVCRPNLYITIRTLALASKITMVFVLTIFQAPPKLGPQLAPTFAMHVQ